MIRSIKRFTKMFVSTKGTVLFCVSARSFIRFTLGTEVDECKFEEVSILGAVCGL